MNQLVPIAVYELPCPHCRDRGGRARSLRRILHLFEGLQQLFFSTRHCAFGPGTPDI
jgi:hypothetical protein